MLSQGFHGAQEACLDLIRGKSERVTDLGEAAIFLHTSDDNLPVDLGQVTQEVWDLGCDLNRGVIPIERGLQREELPIEGEVSHLFQADARVLSSLAMVNQSLVAHHPASPGDRPWGQDWPVRVRDH